MAVNSISPLQAPQIGSSSFSPLSKKQPATETQVQARKDSLELSGQAQQIRDTKKTENLQQVQSQINAGYFNRPDVVRETASRISKAFPKEIKI